MTLATNGSGLSAKALDIPAAAQVAIVVVCIVGCAATHPLANARWSVVLLERTNLTSGTT